VRVPAHIASEDEFAAWVSPHLMAMGHLAARLVGSGDRDDVVQEALTRAWLKRHTFDAARGTPRVWLLAIVADRARRSWKRTRPSIPLLDDAIAPTVEEHDAEASRLDIEQAVRRLPPRMRLAVDCVYFVGLTISEAATVMGVKEGTVKSTLADARDRLRSTLEVPT
jgi:RNA polymerase sigma factor (sigma-70 family)